MHYDNKGGKKIATATTANEDDGANLQGSHIYSGQETRGSKILQHIMGNGRQKSLANLGVLSGVTIMTNDVYFFLCCPDWGKAQGNHCRT